MKHRLFEIYALTVCFGTMICFVIALGTAIYDVIEINFPEFTIRSSEYKRHLANESYSKSWLVDDDQPEEVLTRKRLASYRTELESEKREGKQSLVMSLIIIFIDVAVYLFHWNLAKKARVGVESGLPRNGPSGTQ